MQCFFRVYLYIFFFIFSIQSYSEKESPSKSNYMVKTFENYHFPDFDSSMYTSSLYKSSYERIIEQEGFELEFIESCKIRYSFFCNNISTLWERAPKIPKIIHQIWLGEKPFPERYKEFSNILKKKHPTWIYKLWTDSDIEKFDLINHEFYIQTPSLAEKANILRYELLFQYGGVYIDTDFECLKPLDLFNHCCDFYAGLEYAPTSYNKFIIGNALIASKPKHLILATVIGQISKNWYRYDPWSRINQLERSGTRYFSKVIKEVLCTSKGINVIFPSNVFYPFTGKTIIVQPEAWGIHYWDSTWLKK